MPLTTPPASLLAITPPYPAPDRQQAGSYTSYAPLASNAPGLAYPPSCGGLDFGAKLFASFAGRGPVFAAGHASHKSTERGFTLVELIMVIALSGIVAVMISTVMSRPLQGFVDQSRRAELTDLAATALNRMARDIRLAVPNSVRNENVCPASGCRTLELLAISAGGRYRANQWSKDGERYDPLRLGNCMAKPADECAVELLGPSISRDGAQWLIIYNTTRADIWDVPRRTSPSTILNIGDAELVAATSTQPQKLVIKNAAASNFVFKYASPQKRFYLADKVVGYRCSGNELIRDEFPTLLDSYSYADASPIVNHVDCTKSGFTYEPGTNTRNGLVTLRLSLTKGGETITLLQQLHVDNVP